jgi:hypothetical protein
LTKLPDDVVNACSRFSQGDLIEGAAVTVLADLSRPLTELSARAAALLQPGEVAGEEAIDIPCPFAVIVSQTCDVRSDIRPTIKLAPVFELDDPAAVESRSRSEKRQKRIDDIQSGRLVHRVMLSGPPGYLYADLDTITTVEKTVLLGKERHFGFSDVESYRRFAFRCGHVHDRPAVPSPADYLLTNDLRRFLGELRVESPELFATMRAAVLEECLYLDDWETPTVAQLWFLGHAAIPAPVQAALDAWHANLDASESFSVLPNRYADFSDVRVDEYRDLRVVSHWYLSADDE